MAVLGSEIRVATLTLDNADIDALFGTPVTIVAAPGAGLVAVPLAVAVRMTKSAGTWSASRNLQVQYDGTTANLIQNITILLAQAQTEQLYLAARVSTYTGANNFNPSNTAIEVTLQTGDVSGGPADTVLKISLLYELVPSLY